MSSFSELAKNYQAAVERLAEAQKAYVAAHKEAEALWKKVLSEGPPPLHLGAENSSVTKRTKSTTTRGTKRGAARGTKRGAARGTKRASRARRRRGSIDWAALRERLYEGMKDGTFYSGDELQAMVCYEGNYRNWIRNVVAALHDDGYLEKHGQTRNTRWTKVS